MINKIIMQFIISLKIKLDVEIGVKYKEKE